MKVTKDEGKVIARGPLFPRLHVKDTEKGGAKAPPRNKMALHEQLSVPSQRLTSASPSMLPLSQSNGGSLVPPCTSSSHGHGNERSVLTPFCNSPATAHLAEKVHSYFFKGYKLSSAMGDLERKPITSKNYSSSPATVHSSSNATCNSFQLHNFSNLEKSDIKKLEDDNESRVPIVSQLGITPHFRNSQHSINREKLPCPSSSMQLQSAFQKQFNETITTDVKSRQGLLIQTEEGYKVPQICLDSAPVLLGRNKLFAGMTFSQSARKYCPEPVKRARSLSNQESVLSSVEDSNRMNGLHQKFVTVEEKVICREHALMTHADGMVQGNATIVGGECCLRLSNGDDDQRILNGVKHGSEVQRHNECGSFQVRDKDGNNDVSVTSILDSDSGLMISPDDVVEAIGKKIFWKARKAIVNQQKVFAVQVFELHRLIKVQRLISTSPKLLFEHSVLKDKHLLKAHPIKQLPTDYVLEPKDDSHEPNSRTECAANKGAVKPPLVNGHANKELVELQSNNVPETSVMTDTKLAQWCFGPSPGNRWLVPVMSPSEGLIYKPYAGPCPPTSASGSCEPISATVGSGNVFNTAFSISASHHHHQGIDLVPSIPLGQTYFQHCGLPVTNRSICDMASHESWVQSGYINKFHPLKGIEIQGSAASSPSEMAQGDALGPFPTTPALEVADTVPQTRTCKQQTRVIKVVPHSPRLATESAARIFQSIQEGRRQNV